MQYGLYRSDQRLATPAGMGLPAWTFHVPLHDDELLSSWLCRSAHAHGARPYAFLSLRLPGACVWNRDPDRCGGEAFWAALAEAAGGQRNAYARASLRPWAALLCGREGLVPAQIPLVLAAGVYHRKRRLHGLQFCPACLADGPVRFRREWRLAVVAICPHHGLPLCDGCPSCDAPLAPHRADVGALDRCEACGASLASFPRGQAHDRRVILGAADARAFCVAALGAGDRAVPGFPGSGREALLAFRCLASLCTADAVRSAVAEVFGLSGPISGTPSTQLERTRAADRVPLLALLSAWLADWPASFRVGAAAAGLTRRSFSRLATGAVLGREVDLLAAGVGRRRRPYELRLLGGDMRRLRRRDRGAYMVERARRALAGAGWRRGSGS